MNLLTCILIAIPIGIIFIMLWIYNDYRKYKKKNKLAILLFLLFPTTLSAQYVDAGCQVSFKWLENQKGKLEYTKDGVTYKFIPNDSQWEIIMDQRIFQVGNPIIYQAYCVPLLYESRTVTPCHPPGCAYR